MGKDFRPQNKKPNFSSRSLRGGHGPSRGRDGRPNRGGIGARAKAKTIIEPYPRFPGCFLAKTPKDDMLVTLNLAPGQSVYGEKQIQVEEKNSNTNETTKIEYRVWNLFRSKLGAGIVNGVEKIYMAPGSKVLYLGAASGTTISHVSDLVGNTGTVYGIEISERSGRDLTNMAKQRPNLIPIIEDARKPWRYRMIVSMCDCIFADVAQPDQARIIGLNAQYFLKNNGGFVFSIKANCVDSTAAPEAVFSHQIEELKKVGFKVLEKVTLEPYERDHAIVTGVYRRFKNKKTENE